MPRGVVPRQPARTGRQEKVGATNAHVRAAHVGTGAFARPGLGEARPHAAPRFSARYDLNGALPVLPSASRQDQELYRPPLVIPNRARAL
jgi:hypothetical protein